MLVNFELKGDGTEIEQLIKEYISAKAKLEMALYKETIVLTQTETETASGN